MPSILMIYSNITSSSSSTDLLHQHLKPYKLLNGTTISPVLNSTSIAAIKLFFSTQEAYNSFYPPILLLAFLLVLVFYLLVISPSIANWIVAGRYKDGWRLSRSSQGLGNNEKSTRISRRFSRTSSIGGGGGEWSEKSRLVVEFQHLYNLILLRPVPYTNLTFGQVLACLIFQALVLIFIFIRGGNPMDNYRRAGYIASAILPSVILLATKNSLASIIGKGYDKLNFLHRVAGRMMILIAAIHVFCYFRKYHLDVNLTDSTIWTGTVALTALGLILLTSFPLFRRSFYQIFLASHIIGWITFLIFLPIHAPSTLPYILISLFLYLLDLVLRISKTHYRTATLTALSGGMTKIEIDGLDKGWIGGQHVWLRVWGVKGLGGVKRGESHPFTIANSTSGLSPLVGSHNLTLLAKSTGDWTRALNEVVLQNSIDLQELGLETIPQTLKVFVEGPYGGTMFNNFSDKQTVLLIAGGSGITFAASLLEELIGQANNSRRESASSSIRTTSIVLVWVTKSVASIDWYESKFNSLLSISSKCANLSVEIRLFITGPEPPTFSPIPGVVTLPFRPDLKRILGTVIDDTIGSLVTVKEEGSVAIERELRGGGLAVGVCGPGDLVRDIRREVGNVGRKRAARIGGIVVHSEVFGW